MATTCEGNFELWPHGVFWNVPLPSAWPQSPQTWASCWAASSSAACRSSLLEAPDTLTQVEFSDPHCGESREGQQHPCQLERNQNNRICLLPFLLHGEFQLKYSGIVHDGFISLRRRKSELGWEHFLIKTLSNDLGTGTLLQVHWLCLWLLGSVGHPGRLPSPADWNGWTRWATAPRISQSPTENRGSTLRQSKWMSLRQITNKPKLRLVTDAISGVEAGLKVLIS